MFSDAVRVIVRVYSNVDVSSNTILVHSQPCVSEADHWLEVYWTAFARCTIATDRQLHESVTEKLIG